MSDDLKKPANEQEPQQSLQENAAVRMSTELNEKRREMESPKDAATMLVSETQQNHLGNGYLPMTDGIAKKMIFWTRRFWQYCQKLSSKFQRENVNTIATAIVAIIAVLAFFKDELFNPPSPQFEILNSQVAADSVIIIIAANKVASRYSALDIKFDGVLFNAAGRVIPKSKPQRWSFCLKDHNPPAPLIHEGGHQIQMGFPGMPLSVPFDINFTTINESQFKIKNTYTHPDSTIIIILQNDTDLRRRPLNVEFDGTLFYDAGVVIPDSKPQHWNFRLKKHNPPAALLRNGVHRMRVGFPGMQYSEFFEITFEAKVLPESIVVKSQKPGEAHPDTIEKQRAHTEVKPTPKNGGPVKSVIKKLAFPTLDSNIVKVSLNRNGSGPVSNDYIDRTARILTTLNQHYYADSLKVRNFSSLNDIATAASLDKFSQAFLNKKAFVGQREIKVRLFEKERHMELGPITIFFNADKTPRSLYLIFNQEPKLTDIRLE